MKNKTLFLSAIVSSFVTFSAFASPIEDASELYKKKDYWKSIEILDKLIKEQPEDPEPYLLMSKCYEGLFELDKSMFYFKQYDKFRELKKKKVENIKPSEAIQNNNSNNTFENVSSNKITYLNDDFISDIITQRGEIDKNKKYLSFKDIKKIFSKVPLDTEDILDFNLRLQIKDSYGLSNYEDSILLIKSEADMLSFEIDEKSNLTSESDKEALSKLISKYNKRLEELKTLLIAPITNELDPLGYDKYIELKADPESHISHLEQKKSSFITSYLSATTQIKKLKTSIIADEKELKKKKENIPDRLLEVSKDDLIDVEKQKVQSYLDLKQKIDSDKKVLLNFLAEQNILFDAIKTSNETIKKIKPSYQNKDPKLPEPEVLKRVE